MTHTCICTLLVCVPPKTGIYFWPVVEVSRNRSWAMESNISAQVSVMKISGAAAKSSGRGYVQRLGQVS